jgi:hypothetical protein
LPPDPFAIEEPRADAHRETTAEPEVAVLEGLAPGAVDSWLPPERFDAVEQPVDAPSSPAVTPPGTANERWLVAADLASLVVIGGLMFMNIANTGAGLRLAFAVLFITCVPGWALVRTAGLSAGLGGAAIAVLASLTISAATSTAMVWLNAWHPLGLVAVLAALSAVAILWTLPPSFVALRARR